MRNLYVFAVIMLVALPMLAGAQSVNLTQSAANLTQSTLNMAQSLLNLSRFSPPANSGLTAYLSNYIPNATISGSTFFGNQVVNGNSYVIMKLPGSSNYIVITNQSSKYSIITNTSTIQGVLTPFLVVNYRPSAATISYLNSTMSAYEAYASANLTNCLQATGIYDPMTKTSYVCNATITSTTITNCLQNTCDAVPICGGHLSHRRSLSCRHSASPALSQTAYRTSR